MLHEKESAGNLNEGMEVSEKIPGRDAYVHCFGCSYCGFHFICTYFSGWGYRPYCGSGKGRIFPGCSNADPPGHGCTAYRYLSVDDESYE